MHTDALTRNAITDDSLFKESELLYTAEQGRAGLTNLSRSSLPGSLA